MPLNPLDLKAKEPTAVRNIREIIKSAIATGNFSDKLFAKTKTGSKKPRIYYDSSVIKQKEIEQTLLLDYAKEGIYTHLAPKEEAIKDTRQKTCGRMVVSEARVFATSTAVKNGSETITLLTDNAPNLMGSSPNDLEKYVAEGSNVTEKQGHLKNGGAEYAAFHHNILKKHFYIANREGKNTLIQAPFGLGVYLNRLNDENQAKAKELAITAWIESIKEMADENQAKEFNFIFTFPEPNDHKLITSTAKRLLGKPENDEKLTELGECYKYRKFNIIINQAGILECALEAKKQKLAPLVVQAGSDRTIGGHWDKLYLKTIEEQMGTETDFMCSQAINVIRKLKETPDASMEDLYEVHKLPAFLNLNKLIPCDIEPVIVKKDIEDFSAMLKEEKIASGISIFANGDGKTVYYLTFDAKNSAELIARAIAIKPYYIDSKAVQQFNNTYYIGLTAAEIYKYNVLWNAAHQQIHETPEVIEQYQQKFLNLKLEEVIYENNLIKDGSLWVKTKVSEKKAEANFQSFLEYRKISYILDKKDSTLWIHLDALKENLSRLEEFDIDPAKRNAALKARYQQKFPGIDSIKNVTNENIAIRFKDEKSAAAFRIFLQYHGYPYYAQPAYLKNPLVFVVALDKLTEFDIKQAHIHDTDLHQQKEAVREFLQAEELIEEIDKNGEISWLLKFADSGIPWVMKQFIPTLELKIFEVENSDNAFKLTAQQFYEFYEQLRPNVLQFNDLVCLYKAGAENHFIGSNTTPQILIGEFGKEVLKDDKRILALKNALEYMWSNYSMQRDNSIKRTIRFAVPATLLPEQLDDLKLAALAIEVINANDKNVIRLNDKAEIPPGYIEVVLPWKAERQYDISEVISTRKVAENLTKAVDEQKNNEQRQAIVPADRLPEINKAFNALRQLSDALKCPIGFLNDGESLYVLDDQLLDMLRFVLRKPELGKKIKWDSLYPEKLEQLSRLILYKSSQSQYPFLIDERAVANYKNNEKNIQTQIANLEKAKVPGSCGIYIKKLFPQYSEELSIFLKDENIINQQSHFLSINKRTSIKNEQETSLVHYFGESDVNLDITQNDEDKSIFIRKILRDLNALGVRPAIDSCASYQFYESRKIIIYDQQVWDMLVAAKIINTSKGSDINGQEIKCSRTYYRDSDELETIDPMKLQHFVTYSKHKAYCVIPATKKGRSKQQDIYYPPKLSLSQQQPHGNGKKEVFNDNPPAVRQHPASDLKPFLDSLQWLKLGQQDILVQETGVILSPKAVNEFVLAGILKSSNQGKKEIEENAYSAFEWKDLNLEPLPAPIEAAKISLSDSRQIERQLCTMLDVLNRLTDKLDDLNQGSIKNKVDPVKSAKLAELIVTLREAFADAVSKDNSLRDVNYYTKKFLHLLEQAAQDKNSVLYASRTKEGTVFSFFSNSKLNLRTDKSSTIRKIKAAIEETAKVTLPKPKP